LTIEDDQALDTDNGIREPKKKRAGRPQGSSREMTTARILNSALTCFTRRGYANTTFKHVAQGAGMTSPAIYQYYSSKAELYGATLDLVYQRLIPEIQMASRADLNFREQIKVLLRATVELQANAPEATAFLSTVAVESHREEELRKYFMSRNSNVLEAIGGMFEQAKARGEIKSTRSNANLAMFFLGSTIGMVLYHNGSEDTSMQEGIETMIDLIDNRFFSD
jgi:AcrR family transcriptional regulator